MDATGYVIGSETITYSAGAGPGLAGKTAVVWFVAYAGRKVVSGLASEDLARKARQARIDDARPVRVGLADGSAVTVRAGGLSHFRGLDARGHQVFDDPWIGLYPVTPCCQATGKGSESGVVCRSCYAEVDDYFGGPATVAVPVAVVAP